MNYIHPGYKKPYPIATVLRDLASQEGCDGEPYDVMIAAAGEITRLTAELTALRAGQDALLRAERNKVRREVAKLYENGGGPGLGGWDYFGDFYDAILAMIEPEGK